MYTCMNFHNISLYLTNPNNTRILPAHRLDHNRFVVHHWHITAFESRHIYLYHVFYFVRRWTIGAMFDLEPFSSTIDFVAARDKERPSTDLTATPLIVSTEFRRRKTFLFRFFRFFCVVESVLRARLQFNGRTTVRKVSNDVLTFVIGSLIAESLGV